MGIWRRAWWDAQRSLPRPLRVSETRYHVTGPQVVEQRGLDVHKPVRPPEKWKSVRIFGNRVWIRGHDSVECLWECPRCAALIVGDQWAKETHMGACLGREEEVSDVSEEAEAEGPEG